MASTETASHRTASQKKTVAQTSATEMVSQARPASSALKDSFTWSTPNKVVRLEVWHCHRGGHRFDDDRLRINHTLLQEGNYSRGVRRPVGGYIPRCAWRPCVVEKTAK